MSDLRTWRERAFDVLRTMTGSEEAARAMSENAESRGARAELRHDMTFGVIWPRTELSRRDRSLAVISFLAALGRPELPFHLGAGLNHGLTVEEVEEVMLQIATYAGASFGIAGTNALEQVLAQRDGSEKRRTPPAPLEPKHAAKRRSDGLDVLKTLLGLQLAPEDLEARVLASQGFMGELVLDWAFGGVWSRPQLARRDRSFVTVSALAALNLKHELEIHLKGALNHGVTRSEIEEIMITLTVYGGFPRAIDGLILAHKVFAALNT
jgi:4-carboxymuconolactone decarboxylase